jgi:hypothetical protein
MAAALRAKLEGGDVDAKYAALRHLDTLSIKGKDSEKNIAAIVEDGFILPLLGLIRDEEAYKVSERAAVVLHALTVAEEADVCYEVCKTISECGGIRELVALARDGTGKQKQLAASTLANLAVLPKFQKGLDLRSKIVEHGAVKELVTIVGGGSNDGKPGGETNAKKRSAALALANLSTKKENVAAIVAADGIKPLVELLRGGTGTLGCEGHAARALRNLASESAARSAIVAAGAIAPLMRCVRIQFMSQKSCSAHAKAALELLAKGSADTKPVGAVGDVGAGLQDLVDQARQIQRRLNDALTAAADAREQQASVGSQILSQSLDLAGELAEREVVLMSRERAAHRAYCDMLAERGAEARKLKEENATLKRKLENPEAERLDLTDDADAQQPAAKRQTLRDELDEEKNKFLVRVKDEKQRAEGEKEDAQDLLSPLNKTINALQTKIDELAALAKASGADPRAISVIKERSNV